MAEETKTPDVVSPQVLFRSIGDIIKSGMFPAIMSHAVSEVIKFCDQVIVAEQLKNPIAGAAAAAGLQVVKTVVDGVVANESKPS